jgi:hypothetical protein
MYIFIFVLNIVCERTRNGDNWAKKNTRFMNSAHLSGGIIKPIINPKPFFLSMAAKELAGLPHQQVKWEETTVRICK